MAVQDSGALLVGLLLLFHTWGAWAAVEVSMEDRVEVFRGQTANITCMFQSDDGVGALMIQWSYVIPGVGRQRIYYQDSTTNEIDRRTRFTDRIQVEGNGATGQVVLTIRDVQLEDELDFICQIKSLTDGNGEGLTKLKVFVIPEPPTIEAVGKAISINEAFPSKIATCEVKNGFPRPNITWYKNGIPQYNVPDVVAVLPTVTVESSGLYSVKSELSLKVTKEDKDATLYCDVSFFVPAETRMFESKNFTITVYYPSTSVNVWVESPKGKIKEGDSVELHCSGDGNTPSIYTMKNKYEEHSDSTWVLENVTRLQSGPYECSSMDTDTYDEITGTVNVFVNYLDPAVVKPEGPSELPIGAEMTATCNALSSLTTQITWFKDGQEISKGNTLNLKDATLDTAGMYKCVVTAPEIEGMETSGMLEVHVQSPPEITKPDSTDIEETFENIVKLECKARGFPVPTVMWTTSDGKVLKTASQEETKDGVLHSVTNFKVTSDITVFCNASNVYGTDAVIFNIKAIKPETAIPPKRIKKEGSGVIIAVIIICILLLAVLGSVLYYLYKKGKICGRSGKQDLTKEKSNKDNIVVEMKSDNTEEAVLLGVNGEKQPTSDQ